jgi:hypothetical protein
MRLYNSFLFALSCFLLLALCPAFQGMAQQFSANKDLQDSVVAWVGEKPITVREFMASYEFGPGFPKRQKDSKRIHLSYMINEKLLALQGEDKKYDTTVLYKTLHRALLSDIATEELYRQRIMPRVKLSETEISDAVADKNNEIYLRWLFYSSSEAAQSAYVRLQQAAVFDSLFTAQIADSIMRDQRTFKTDRFKLWQKNPTLARIADSLKVGSMTKPVQAGDGWYIVTIDSMYQNPILNESEMLKERQEVTAVLQSKKMDAYAGRYVDSLMRLRNPVIDGKAFQIIRGYIGRYELSKELFTAWGLQGKADSAYAALDNGKKLPPGSFPLVRLADTVLTINDMIAWYTNLVDYLHINKEDKAAFSANVESLIWRMVRDYVLTKTAQTEGLEQSLAVTNQISWWQDKILYAMVREDLKNALYLDKPEISLSLLNPKTDKDMSVEINKKLFRELLGLKAKHKVTVNEPLLKRVVVQDEENPKAIDAYIVKKGGLFPHPAFPSIDTYWQSWQ